MIESKFKLLSKAYDTLNELPLIYVNTSSIKISTIFVKAFIRPPQVGALTINMILNITSDSTFLYNFNTSNYPPFIDCFIYPIPCSSKSSMNPAFYCIDSYDEVIWSNICFMTSHSTLTYCIYCSICVSNSRFGIIRFRLLSMALRFKSRNCLMCSLFLFKVWYYIAKY